MKPKLIDEWKSAWKFLSMQGMALAATVQLTWVSLPDDWKASIPSKYIAGITVACLILGIAGRVVKQGGNDANT